MPKGYYLYRDKSSVTLASGDGVALGAPQWPKGVDHTDEHFGSVVVYFDQVELPIAVPVIMAGVRVAVVINIGITAIATYIGAGGLGAFISRGISQTDTRQLITGALAVSLLAIFADYFLLWVQRRLTPKGLRLAPARVARAA
jgi:ABC-type proline/glycine betaine transport system permease subunit